MINLAIRPHFLVDLQRLGFDLNVRTAGTSSHALQLAVKLRQEASAVDDAVSSLTIEGLAMELCAEIFRERARDTFRNSDRLIKVDRILRDRFRESVTLTELAEAAGVHPVHLARAFRKRFGCSVGEQIRRLRLDAACLELLCSRAPIAEIATRLGFSDQSHLSRAFKRSVGMSPGDFRSSPSRNAGHVSQAHLDRIA